MQNAKHKAFRNLISKFLGCYFNFGFITVKLIRRELIRRTILSIMIRKHHKWYDYNMRVNNPVNALLVHGWQLTMIIDSKRKTKVILIFVFA